MDIHNNAHLTWRGRAELARRVLDEGQTVDKWVKRFQAEGLEGLHDRSSRPHTLRDWLHTYNWHRPHGSLKAKPPSSRHGLTEDNLLRLHS
jgi:transposase InsO family protein